MITEREALRLAYAAATMAEILDAAESADPPFDVGILGTIERALREDLRRRASELMEHASERADDGE